MAGSKVNCNRGKIDTNFFFLLDLKYQLFAFYPIVTHKPLALATAC